MIEFEIPMRLINSANVREHWSKRAKRAKQQRNNAFVAALMNFGKSKPKPPITITIERIGKRRMDTDGLAISAKAFRDGIADALGIDDGDPRLTWEYRQSIGKEYSVKITIRGSEWISLNGS